MRFFFNIFSIVNTGLKYFIGLDKDLCRYGRNTQICQLQGRGTHNPNSFIKNQIFLKKFLWKYF